MVNKKMKIILSTDTVEILKWKDYNGFNDEQNIFFKKGDVLECDFSYEDVVFYFYLKTYYIDRIIEQIKVNIFRLRKRQIRFNNENISKVILESKDENELMIKAINQSLTNLWFDIEWWGVIPEITMGCFCGASYLNNI